MNYDYESDENAQPTAGSVVSESTKGGLFKCEMCSKAYRHLGSLAKHRWEHTKHWQDTSMLSKNQQVQMLEAATILFSARAPTGISLPEEKGFWPAAVSPPSSGLLGSQAINIDILTGSASSREKHMMAATAPTQLNPSEYLSPYKHSHEGGASSSMSSLSFSPKTPQGHAYNGDEGDASDMDMDLADSPNTTIVDYADQDDVPMFEMEMGRTSQKPSQPRAVFLEDGSFSSNNQGRFPPTGYF